MSDARPPHQQPPAPIVPRLGPPGLPVVVTAALWSTAMLRGKLDPDDLTDRAAQAVEAVTPAAAHFLGTTVATWRDVGEQTVLAVLPRPGRPGRFPVGPQALGASMADGAVGVLLAPLLGEGVVLRLEPFGHALDGGWLLDVEPIACTPVPAPRLEAVDLRGTQRALAEATRRGLEVLEPLGDMPVWAGQRAGGPAVSTAGDLPPGIEPEVLDLLERAAVVATLTTEGRDTHAVHGEATRARHEAMARLHHAALDALEEGTLVAGRGLRRKASGGPR
ncbi:hypothetical protein [Kytococcus schroeteri]|uniref:hypothetical protein n=1 Tax=Kytococcus schroeteri TaxID=138300 RepID=UPI0011439319|nr:hypothetical protein [Kytococcus schroeteri]